MLTIPRFLLRKTFGLATGTRLGRGLLLLAALFVVAYFTRSFLADEAYPAARDALLRSVGYGLFPMAAWLLAVIGVLRFRPRLLIRRWRWSLASVLLIAAAQTVMGSLSGAHGILADETLGGYVGQALWRDSVWWGAPIAVALAALAATIFQPGATYRALRHLSKGTGGFLLLLVRSLGMGMLWSVRYALIAVRAAFAAIGEARRSGRTAAAPGSAEESDSASGPHGYISADEHPPIADLQSPAEERPAPARVKTRMPEPVRASAPNGQDADATDSLAPEGSQSAAAAHQGAWATPPLTMLETGPEVSITETETTEVAKCIEETLQHHGVEVAVNQVKPGPTVTLYGLTPGWVRRVRDVRERDDQDQLIRDAAGKPVVSRKEEQTRVKVDSITAREKDLALALATPSLRIQAPVPGESIVGIEVPNRNPVLVSLRSVLEAGTVQDMARKNGLPLALGQGSGGDAVVVDLRKLPHLLIAGATGSGKSVCINTVIVSLLTQMPPDQLRLLLIDPKRVELTPFNGIPHLVTPVVVEADEAVTALKGIRREMLRRYKLLEEVGVRNVDGYRSHPRATEPMPYLVIAIDELADLMMSAPYDVEQTLTRLAQLGRATGIHLIVATQRPSVDVVTGLIKANFPSRLSFAVVSQVDSRTILDSGGAERLLGKGDMLFLSTDTPKPQRVQGAYLSDREIERVVEFWQDQHGPPLPQLLLEPEPEDQAGSSNGSDRSGPQDELLDKAIELASRYSHVSTSLLQRRLRIGYPRAARLMDQLEDEGVIGTGEPGKSREVLGTGG